MKLLKRAAGLALAALMASQAPALAQPKTLRIAMTAADVVLVASGTATLEAAIHGLPHTLIYKVSPATYAAGKLLIRVPFLGMVNLLAGRQVLALAEETLGPITQRRGSSASPLRTMTRSKSGTEAVRTGALRYLLQVVDVLGKADREVPLATLLPPDWDVQICYQSRVGPLKWIGPPTDACIEKAARDGKAILLSPVAFVSEHIETLVELDIEYRHLAEQHGAKCYLRAPALGVDAGFVETLADLVEDALADTGAVKIRSGCGGRICPADRKDCPNHRAPANKAA